MYSDEYVELFKQNPGSKVCLVHTRQPTSGGIGDEHAQPFLKGTTATVHNGWFWNCAEVKHDFGVKKVCNVDSALVTGWTHAYGADTLPEFIEATEGSSAIAATYDDKLWLIRSGNPTVSATIKLSSGNSCLVFGSTAKQVMAALRHVWLFTDVRVQDTKDGILYNATPKGLEQLTDKKASHSWNASRYKSYGLHGSWTGEGDWEWDDKRKLIVQKNPSKTHEDSDRLISIFLPAEKRLGYWQTNDKKEEEALLDEARLNCIAAGCNPDDPTTYHLADDDGWGGTYRD